MDVVRDLFSFDGRANRARYIWHVLFDDLVMAIMGIGATVLFTGALAPLAAIALLGIGFCAAWGAVAVTVKRFHDLDRPGWHLLLLMIPLYNIYLTAILFVVEGTAGDNQYGVDPLRSTRRRWR